MALTRTLFSSSLGLTAPKEEVRQKRLSPRQPERRYGFNGRLAFCSTINQLAEWELVVTEQSLFLFSKGRSEMRRTLSLIIMAALCTAGSVWGASQESAKQMSELSKPAVTWNKAKDAASECTAGGVIRDDGTFEDGVRVPFVSDARFVQLLVPSSYPALLDRVCVCWDSSASLSSMSYNLLAYDDNGNNGQPGTFLGGKQVSAVNLTAFADELFWL
jgi:hypothetical protein